MGPHTEQPLLERTGERQAIDEAIPLAGKGAGRVVVIEGTAGIGKSSLLSFVGERARRAGMQVLSARGMPLEREFPFGGVLQLLRPLRGDGAGPLDERLFTGAAELSRSLLGTELEAPADGGSVAIEPSFALLDGLYWLLSNISEERPVALVIDDAQWLDGPSLRFTDYLANRVDDVPVLLAVAVRTGEATTDAEAIASLRSHPRTSLLCPEPLSAGAVAGLVRNDRPDADEEFCATCHTVTAGNPFYLHELLAAAAESRIPPTAAGATRVAGLGPEGISRSVLARMGRLAPAARELAATVVAAGDGIPLHRAATVAGLEGAEAALAADQLAEAEVLASGETLTFIHPLVREAVQADLPAAGLARRHLEVARLLHAEAAAPEAVAAQLLQASRGEDEWVVEVLRAAARRARERGAPEVSARYLARALEEGVEGARRGEILVESGLAVATAGDPSGSEQILVGVELLDDPAARAVALMGSGRLLGVNARWDGAAALFKRAEEEVASLPPELGAALALVARGGFAVTGCYDLGTREEARKALTQLVSSEAAGLPTLGCTLLATQAMELLYVPKPAEQASSLARRALDAEAGDGFAEQVGFRIATAALSICDETEPATKAAERLLAWGRRKGAAVDLAGASYARCMLAFYAGRIAEVAIESQVVIDSYTAGLGVALPTMHLALSTAYLERGEFEEAEAALEIEGGESRWIEDFFYPFLLEGRGNLLLTGGRMEEAHEAFARAGELARTWGLLNPALSHLNWRSGAALALRSLGDVDQARSLVAEELELAETFGVARPIGVALRSAGLVAPAERSLELLRRSVETLEPSPARLELSRSLIELGAQLRRGGQRRDAREPLKRGLELARACGALALVERADTELRAAGGRPRKLLLSGVESLTPSERRVADLAAEGLTNREIAERLYVTRNTIGTHLEHVFSKLEIRSRRELPDALSRDLTG